MRSERAAGNTWTSAALDRLTRREHAALRQAACEVVACRRVLAKSGKNVVGQVLAGQGVFVEHEHYPQDDVFDPETGGLYYYHAHRCGEHGHFHTFVRRNDGALVHLVAVSMDAFGDPIGLFTTNRWVTDEIWVGAGEACELLDRFAIELAVPCWATNRWLSALLRLYRPWIRTLLERRELMVPSVHQREDREVEVLDSIAISVPETIAALDRVPQPRRTKSGGKFDEC